jgi:hypothetical protein
LIVLGSFDYLPQTGIVDSAELFSFASDFTILAVFLLKYSAHRPKLFAAGHALQRVGQYFLN